MWLCTWWWCPWWCQLRCVRSAAGRWRRGARQRRWTWAFLLTATGWSWRRPAPPTASKRPPPQRRSWSAPGRLSSFRHSSWSGLSDAIKHTRCTTPAAPEENSQRTTTTTLTSLRTKFLRRVFNLFPHRRGFNIPHCKHVNTSTAATHSSCHKIRHGQLFKFFFSNVGAQLSHSQIKKASSGNTVFWKFLFTTARCHAFFSIKVIWP